MLIREEEHELTSYLNTAIEAAQLGKIADCNYFLEQARQSAISLGWEKTSERYLAARAECIQALEAR